MDETAKLQQKAFKDYWAKCKPHHEVFLEALRAAQDSASRALATAAYLESTQLFYDAYYAQLKAIGHNAFSASIDL